MLMNNFTGRLRNVSSLWFISLFTVFPLNAFTDVPNWQGFYLGAYLGGGVGNAHFSTNTGSITDSSYFTTAEDINATNNAGSSQNTPVSITAGIQAGHNWIWKQMVYGVVADVGVLPLITSTQVNSVYPDTSDNHSIYTSLTTHWLFSLRGRLGYQTVLHSSPSLLYLTGGIAVTQLKVTNHFSDNSPLAGSGGGSLSENQIGWTAGAGIELASFAQATLNLEYLYIYIPSVTTTSSISNSVAGFGIPAQSLSSPFTTTGSLHTNLIRLGLNYRFGGSFR